MSNVDVWFLPLEQHYRPLSLLCVLQTSCVHHNSMILAKAVVKQRMIVHDSWFSIKEL